MSESYLDTSGDERRSIDNSSIFGFLALPEFRVLCHFRRCVEGIYFISVHGFLPCLTKERSIDDERGNVFENSSKDNSARTN